ncbi:acetyl-CoA C-acetyltransferase, partial [Pantoea sp. ANP04]
MGEATEQLREKHNISREDQDAFSALSHQQAAAAWDAGKYDNLVVSVPPPNKPGTAQTRDETIRADSTAESLSKLRTVFRTGENATVTAGNASPMNDGASAAFIGSARGGELLGAAPLARIVSNASFALDPQFFGFAPVEAANKALAKAGLKWTDISVVELNEAFAAQSL